MSLSLRRVWSSAGVLGVALAGVFIASTAFGQLGDGCVGSPTVTLTNVTTVVTGDSTLATSDVSASGCSFLDDQDVWCRFTAPSTGGYVLSTDGSDFDTTLALYTVCGGAAIACNDDEVPDQVFTSLINTTLSAGQTYLVRVSGYLFDAGSITLAITRPDVVVPATSVCCRGATCAVLTAGQGCSVPASPPVGAVVVNGQSVCNAAGQTLAPCCYADFDKLGGRTIDDIFIYLNAWFALSPYTKVGGDGVSAPNIDDIFVFINAWFAGC